MNLMKWLDARVKRMTFMDVALLKICVAAFTLMIVKLWPVILTPHWAIFALLFLLAYGPIMQMHIGIMTERLPFKYLKEGQEAVSFSEWMRSRIDNLTVLNVALIEITVMIFTILAVKLWPALLTPDWKIFGTIFVVTYVPLAVKLLILKDGHA